MRAHFEDDRYLLFRRKCKPHVSAAGVVTRGDAQPYCPIVFLLFLLSISLLCGVVCSVACCRSLILRVSFVFMLLFLFAVDLRHSRISPRGYQTKYDGFKTRTFGVFCLTYQVNVFPCVFRPCVVCRSAFRMRPPHDFAWVPSKQPIWVRVVICLLSVLLFFCYVSVARPAKFVCCCLPVATLPVLVVVDAAHRLNTHVLDPPSPSPTKFRNAFSKKSAG